MKINGKEYTPAKNIKDEDFYTKEFVSGDSSLSRADLEGLPSPFVTIFLTDEDMAEIVRNTDQNTRSDLRLSQGEKIDFSNDRHSEIWWKDMEDALTDIAGCLSYEDMTEEEEAELEKFEKTLEEPLVGTIVNSIGMLSETEDDDLDRLNDEELTQFIVSGHTGEEIIEKFLELVDDTEGNLGTKEIEGRIIARNEKYVLTFTGMLNYTLWKIQDD